MNEKKSQSNIKSAIFTNISILIYIVLFFGYFYDNYFEKYISYSGKAVIDGNGKNLIFAVILLAATIAEVWAYKIKSQLWGEGETDGAASAFILWIFHTVVSIIISIFAIGSIGINVMDNLPPWSLIVFIIVVIKELALLLMLSGSKVKKKNSRSKIIFADILLLFYYYTAFSLIISTIFLTENYESYLMSYSYNSIAFIVNSLLVVFLFSIFYFPLRIPYLITAEKEKSLLKTVSKLITILTAFSVLMPLYSGENSLEDALKNPDKVEMLFLNNQDLKEIRPEIGKLKNLRVLNLGYNQLDSLPQEMANLKKLEWINLAGNNYNEIPEVLKKCTSLKYLDIHYNRLNKFPVDINWLKKIKTFKISSNPINKDEILRLKNDNK